MEGQAKPMAAFHEENQRDQKISVCPGLALPGHSIRCYEEQHCWIIDQVLLPCSAAEYHCLKLLLEHANACVPFASFLNDQEIFPTASANAKQERPRVAYMMSKLRAKVWALGFDIVNVWNVGYILLSESSGEIPLVSDDRSNGRPEGRHSNDNRT